MYQFLFIFFIYAFLGWCTEVSYAALQTGKFVNRGSRWPRRRRQ